MPSPEVLQEMVSKHPQATPPLLPLGPVPPSVILSDSAVLKGMRSFPNSSPLDLLGCVQVTFGKQHSVHLLTAHAS